MVRSHQVEDMRRLCRRLPAVAVAAAVVVLAGVLAAVPATAQETPRLAGILVLTNAEGTQADGLGSLTPSFSPDVYEYSIHALPTVEAVTLRFRPARHDSLVKIGPPGDTEKVSVIAASRSFALSDGDNDFELQLSLIHI